MLYGLCEVLLSMVMKDYERVDKAYSKTERRHQASMYRIDIQARVRRTTIDEKRYEAYVGVEDYEGVRVKGRGDVREGSRRYSKGCGGVCLKDC